MERVGRQALWSRALLVGLVAFFLGIAGHVVADGLLPGVGVLLAVLAFSVLMGVPVLDRRASRLRLAVLLMTGQAFIHLCLSVTAGHVGDPVRARTTTPGEPRGLEGLPVVDSHRVGSLQDAYTASADRGVGGPALPVGHLFDDLTAHAPMMLAHLLAAALVGLWLAQGERYLWALVDLLGQRVALVLRHRAPVTPTATGPTYAVVGDAVAGFRSLWLALPRSRRGPPHLLVVS